MAGSAGFGAVRTAWVLDGATGIGGRNYVSEGPTDAAWLARALSGGYWRLVDHFRRYDAAGLLKASFERGPDALLDELRALEAADPDCLAFPRIKPMDDATALILRF